MSFSWSVSNRLWLDRLYREHNGWLYRWLKGQRWTVLPPEDIVSEVFLALLEMPNVGALRQPRAMMTTIARRLIYDARRRNDYEQAYAAELAQMPEALDISAEERLIIIQVLREIDVMLASLTPKARGCFLMSQIDGLPYKTIAEEMGISVSMVRKYVAQGLRQAYLVAGRME